MKKTLFILTAMLLFIGAVIAQPRMSAQKADMPKSGNFLLTAQKANFSQDVFKSTRANAPKSRDVVYSEGFESTTGTNLPTGWTKTSGTNWITIANGQKFEQVEDVFEAHGGTRSLGRSWYRSGNNWAFSAGFDLEAGTAYTVKFWFDAPGYEDYGEHDDFEVKIGSGQTAADMTNLIFSNISNDVYGWELATGTFTPTAAGTYYLGFHDLNPVQTGIWIAIDDIEITGSGTAPGECDPAKNFAVKYTADCKAELTWNEPFKNRANMLWENTDINSQNYGQASCWWTGGGNGRVVADDFDVESKWSIETITTYGFYGQEASGPVNMGVKIYTNDGGKPGTEIYSNLELPVDDDGAGIYTIALPTPFVINTPGKYWIGIVGVYNTPTPTTQEEFNQRNFFVLFGSTPIGEQLKAKDFAGIFGGGDWKNVTPGTGGGPVISMYFTIEGTKEALPVNKNYNVYRDGTLVKGNLNAIAYTDEGFDATAEHTWEVKVICEPTGESAPVSVTLDACDKGICNPATITEVKNENNCHRINWTMPAAKAEVTLTQGGDPDGNAVGAGKATFTVAHRFTPADLVAVKGGVLNKIVFTPTYGSTQSEPGHTYELRVYQGGDWSVTPRTPGTLVMSQPLNNDDLDFSGYENIIELATPVIIDASKELWIGFHCLNIAAINDSLKYPAATDSGPRKEGLGNVMFFNNKWQSLYEVASSLNYNWFIQGKAQVTPSTITIYRDGTKVAEGIEGTSYLNCDFTPAQSICYKVEVHCPNGNISDLSNEKCIKDDAVKENAKAAFSIVPNPATSSSVKITSGNNFHTIEMISFLGQTVLSQPNVGNTTTLDVSNLPNGVYFVRIISEQGVNVQKFVKQ